MLTQFDSRSRSPAWRLRLFVASSIAAIGLALDVSQGQTWQWMAPQIAAAAIAMPLPRRIFSAFLLALGLTVIAPAMISPAEADLFPRAATIVCLIVVAIAGFTSRLDTASVPVASNAVASTLPAGANATADDSTHLSEELLEASSTLIRMADEQVDDDLAATSPELDTGQWGGSPNHLAAAVARLRRTDRFSDSQIELVESELRGFEADAADAVAVKSLQLNDIVGRFRIERQLGRGGVASVYSGRDCQTGEPAAIKILHNVRVSERFRREMNLVQQLAHPNIVTAYEAGEYHGLHFIAMELLRGPDLNVLVNDQGALDWSEATPYILQTARALEHAHQRELIHRDIKPGNIILNGSDTVKLTDLGLAAHIPHGQSDQQSAQHDTHDGQLAGTLPYMAPEQARCLAAANEQSDIYALGATWYYLLTGKPRLRGSTFNSQLENLLVKRKFNRLPDHCLPESLGRIYESLVAYDPKDRFKDCSQIVVDLEHALVTAGHSVSREEIKVLIVEDSHTDMMLTIEMLRQTNQCLSIYQAKNLSEGIATFRDIPIDLVLLDLTLPDSCGVATVAAFRQIAGFVPIVVLTGMTDQDLSTACIDAGASNFLCKSGLDAHTVERMIFVTLSRCAIDSVS